MITPAHIQQQFARHGLQLARYARSPSLCDRRIGALYRPGSVAADRRQNLVLIYLRSAKARLAIVRIFSSS